MDVPILFNKEPEGLPVAVSRSDVLPDASHWATGPSGELDFHASGFVARVEGVWTDKDIAQFRHFLDLRHLAPTDGEMTDSLQRALDEYNRSDNRLFLCGARPCCRVCGFDVSEAAVGAASRMAGLPISITGCQGRCKHAPVLSLRLGDQSQRFAQVESGDDWLAVLTFIRSAVKADTLLVDSGDAEPFLHDPVHEHSKPDARLKSLQFLLGHFRGEGRFALSAYTFQKEVVGTPEAGGRVIALRMAASYPLADGGKDTHRALVIVGPKPGVAKITGRAYTDGGGTREYQVALRDGALLFADALPEHNRRWKRSRKLLKPTAGGFEERLEVDAGAGFVTYYTISMNRIAAL